MSIRLRLRTGGMNFGTMFNVQHGAARGALAVLSGAFVHLTLGTLYTIGNLNVYFLSCLCASDDFCEFPAEGRPSPTYNRYQGSLAWIFAAAGVGQSCTMFLGGRIEKKIGPRLTLLIGALTISLAVFLASFSVHSLPLLLLTQGALFGVGCGIAYSAPIVCGWRWFPKQQGLVVGCVVAGFGAGAFIFNQVQTKYINPEGKSCEFGCPPEVTERLPQLLRTLALVYTCMQLMGCLLVANPPNADPADDASEELLRPTDRQESSDEGPLERSEESIHLVKPVSLTPAEMVRSPSFWMLYVGFICNAFAVTFTSVFWKLYGQAPDGAHITNDTLLARVGAIASLFNGMSRIAWGHLGDRYGYRPCLATLSVIYCLLIATFAHTEGSGMYTLWVCALFFCLGGNFSLFPSCIVDLFGPEYSAQNYGLLFTSQIVSALTAGWGLQKLLASQGWQHTADVVALGPFFTFLLILLTYTQTRRVPPPTL